MITKQEALHKAEEQFSELLEMVEEAIENGWRIDELERSSFAKLLTIGQQALTAFVAAQGDGNAGPQVELEGRTLQRLPKPHQRRYVSIYVAPSSFDVSSTALGKGKRSSRCRWMPSWDCLRARFPTCWRIGWSGCA